MYAHVSALWPIAMRPVKPVPIATTTRPGASCSKRRDRARLRERMPQVRHEHRRTEPDARRALRGQRRDHPDVAVQRGRVEQPGPLVAEPLGLDDVVDDVRAGRETRTRSARSAPVLCPGELRDERREVARLLAGDHGVRVAPTFAALAQPVGALRHRADERERRREHVVGIGAEELAHQLGDAGRVVGDLGGRRATR